MWQNSGISFKKVRYVKKLTQFLLFFLFIAIIVEVVIFSPQLLEFSGDTPPTVRTHEEVDDSVDQLLTGIHLIESQKDEKEWELWADKAKTFRRKSSWDLEEVRVIFYGSKGVVFNVRGDRGIVDTKSKNMEIMGNVVTKTSNGYEFYTETVRYKSDDRSLFSPEKINMLGPKEAQDEQMTLLGRVMEANLNTSFIEIKNDVEAERPLTNGKRAFIKSQRAHFSGKSNYARFLDNVVIDYETMRLTGPDAVFNYDEKLSAVSSLLVQGGAKVSDIDKWATSETVNVEFLKEEYIFRGDPRVVQNSDELRGEEIVFYNGGKRVKIKKTRATLDEKTSGALN